MERLEKECPRCKGERGFWSNARIKTGMWTPCIMCKTQGKVKVTNEAEYLKLVRSVTHPEKVKTKQRGKGG